MNLPLSTAFTVSHRFWVVVFSFSFISRHILISFLISSVIYSVVIQQLCPPKLKILVFSGLNSVQFSSVTQACPTLCDPKNHSMPGLPVHHHLPEYTQTHVHRVSDAIQPSHPGSSPLLLPPIPPSIRVFSNESTLRMRWPKY